MSAILSRCGKYRYRLTRSVGMGDRVVAFIGVNPSTADATTDDATVRKWCGFARRWGFDRVEVVNLFAYRSTNVRALANVHDPVGPENDRHIADVLSATSLVVPCWGSASKIPFGLCMRIGIVRCMLEATDVEMMSLGTTKHGDPKHPLMLGYDTQLEPWPARLAGERA